jgi:hypothetical protein
MDGRACRTDGNDHQQQNSPVRPYGADGNVCKLFSRLMQVRRANKQNCCMCHLNQCAALTCGCAPCRSCLLLNVSSHSVCRRNIATTYYQQECFSGCSAAHKLVWQLIRNRSSLQLSNSTVDQLLSRSSCSIPQQLANQPCLLPATCTHINNRAGLTKHATITVCK